MILNPMQAFVLYEKPSLAKKTATTKLWLSDESSLFTVLWGPFLGKECFSWKTNWPLTCYLKQILFLSFFTFYLEKKYVPLNPWSTTFFWLRLTGLYKQKAGQGRQWERAEKKQGVLLLTVAIKCDRTAIGPPSWARRDIWRWDI